MFSENRRDSAVPKPRDLIFDYVVVIKRRYYSGASGGWRLVIPPRLPFSSSVCVWQCWFVGAADTRRVDDTQKLEDYFEVGSGRGNRAGASLGARTCMLSSFYHVLSCDK